MRICEPRAQRVANALGKRPHAEWRRSEVALDCAASLPADPPRPSQAGQWRSRSAFLKICPEDLPGRKGTGIFCGPARFFLKISQKIAVLPEASSGSRWLTWASACRLSMPPAGGVDNQVIHGRSGTEATSGRAARQGGQNLDGKSAKFGQAVRWISRTSKNRFS